MKKINITISYDEEKVSTLKIYLGQKELSLEGELEKCIDGLYAKQVPSQVQSFIALRSGTAAPVAPSKPKAKRKELPNAPKSETIEDRNPL